jgi:hypothetical protein
MSDNKDALQNAISYMLDNDVLKFGKTIADILQAKAEEAIDAAKEVVADEMYNFSDEETETEEEND